MEQQSNDGIETEINYIDRFINSRVGKKAEFMSNSIVRDNGLNHKNADVKESKNVVMEENSHYMTTV